MRISRCHGLVTLQFEKKRKGLSVFMVMFKKSSTTTNHLQLRACSWKAGFSNMIRPGIDGTPLLASLQITIKPMLS